MKEIKYSRRDFLNMTAMSLGATELALIGFVNAQFTNQKQTGVMNSMNETKMPFGPIKQIETSLLNVGYVEVGPLNGTPVILLHGWPYDIYSYAEVAPLLV